MSDSKLKPSTNNVYSTIKKLFSPNNEANWDNWLFAMRMMLQGRNLEYVVEGGYEEGFNTATAILPDATVRADNHLVSSIITTRVHEENFVTIAPCQDSARRMWRALSATHQNTTASGRYMHLWSMMTLKANSDEDVSKLIGTMDAIRQRLLNICPDRTVSVDDIYISSLISALPEDWNSVTAPLELQAAITPVELKTVLRGHLTKTKNRGASSTVSTSTALSAAVPVKKGRAQQNTPRPDCSYCQRKGHLAESCHRKLLDNQRKEINLLKQLMKHHHYSKTAKAAHLSDLDSDSSIEAKPSAKQSSMSNVKFSRAACSTSKSLSDHLSYNADTGCKDTMLMSSRSLL